MTKGRALAIFENIENATVSIEEKGLAIYIVVNMATHNSVTKASMLKVIRWLLDRAFEIRQEAQDERSI